MTEPARAVLGAQGLQELRAWADTSLEPALAYATALLRPDRAELVGIELDPARAALPELSDAGVRVLGAGEFDPRPVGDVPLVYHVLAAPAHLPLWRLVPRWAISPGVLIVVTIHDTPDRQARSRALLRMGDALIATSQAVGAELTRVLGAPEDRLHVLDAGATAAQVTDEAYGAAVRRWERRTTPRVRVGPVAERSRKAGLASRRRRLAIVTPLPPSRSGIAFYSARLIAAIAHQLDVDVYREDDLTANPFDPAAVRCLPAGEFELRWELTRPTLPPLYCIGNNRYHVQAWRALMHQRGDVLLHDVNLAGLYRMLADTGTLSAQQLRERFRLIEGQAADTVDATPPDPDVLMVGEVVDRSRRVYVHTEAARAMILRKRPRRSADVFVVPFAMPKLACRLRRGEANLVSAFGYIQHSELLLDSATEILARRPEVTVRVFGDAIRPGELEELRAEAWSRGLARRLEFLGWSDKGYERELTRATVALQLRRYAHGEMSASIADCFAAGLPTVVNDFGSSSELPPEAVVRVPERPSPAEVASAVIALLDNSDRRAALSAAALAHAEASSAERSARALCELITVGAAEHFPAADTLSR